MPEQIENMLVIDELWQWKEDPEYFSRNHKRMRDLMADIEEAESEVEDEYII